MTPRPADIDRVLPFPRPRIDGTDDESDRPGLRETLGEVLRDERHQQQRTLRDVAARAAVSVPYLSEIERGRKDVSADVLEAIGRSLEIGVADVLDRTARRLRAGAGGQRGTSMLALAA